MIIAIASGKGGTGKTTVCAALADIWPQPVHLVDLDVEEPNLHLFLRPEISRSDPAYLPVPKVDEASCTCCGACSEICQFKAISVLGEVILTFPEMCHGCGGCMAVCPEGAISEEKRALGEVARGRVGENRFYMGRLRVGEAMSPPLMRQVWEHMSQDLAGAQADVIVDCPPGVSCPAVTAVSHSDIILLVSEPTPFGLYDFRLAHEAFTPLGKPMAAVINRAGLGDRGLEDYCRAQGIPILARIPFEQSAARAYASGQLINRSSATMQQTFQELCAALRSWGQAELEAVNA